MPGGLLNCITIRWFRLSYRPETGKRNWRTVCAPFPACDIQHTVSKSSLWMTPLPTARLRVAAQFPVQTLAVRTRRQAAACRNLAARQAKGEILAFMDSDCMADPLWLHELLPTFRDPAVGAVGGLRPGDPRAGWNCPIRPETPTPKYLHLSRFLLPRPNLLPTRRLVGMLPPQIFQTLAAATGFQFGFFWIP